MSEEQLNAAYIALIEKHPDYYTKTWNNQNFLFLKNFDYSTKFLDFFSKKIDLNFLEGNKSSSPLTFSLQEAINYRYKKLDFNTEDKNSKDIVQLSKMIDDDSGNLFFIFLR